MPFIDSKVTVKIDREKEEAIKRRLGEAIGIFPGKSEGFLMVGFEDEYTLYFKGNACEKAAFVDVRVFGNASGDACSRMTGEICRIYEEELGIPGSNIYVTYQSIQDWGWNGTNF